MAEIAYGRSVIAAAVHSPVSGSLLGDSKKSHYSEAEMIAGNVGQMMSSAYIQSPTDADNSDSSDTTSENTDNSRRDSRSGVVSSSFRCSMWSARQASARWAEMSVGTLSTGCIGTQRLSRSGLAVIVNKG
jgi:hypothetical protein